MGICYDDNAVKGPAVPVPYHIWNAVGNYLTHYNNMLYLTFILNNSDRPDERRQANHELTIANKKMGFWQKHPNYVQDEVNRGILVLKKKWGV